MIPLYWLSMREGGPARNAWDQDIIDWLAPSTHFRTQDVGQRLLSQGGVVVIPGRFNVEHVETINQWINQLRWAVVIITSDEESLFPWRELHHPNLRIYIQSPRPDLHSDPSLRFLPVGAPEPAYLSTLPVPRKSTSVFFSGQVNHRQRDEMLAAFTDYPHASITPSPGFTLGMDRKTYLASLAAAKVVPCPSGPASADSFRVWEALEAGCVPIVDDGPTVDSEGRAVTDYPRGFWEFFDPPFPVVDNWRDAPRIADALLEQWPQSANRVSAWWQLKKRELRNRLLDDVAELSGVSSTKTAVTVCIPTSPTPNNPDFSHLSLTIEAICSNLPGSEILLMIDGVHPNQSHLHDAYNEYIRRVLWMTNHHWTNTTPLLFEDYLHQSGKMRRSLPHVRTPLILWNEHDTPLEGDIDWNRCIDELMGDRLDVIRFYHESNVHPEHEWLMRGRHDDLFLRTVQQSGRPHLARTDYYQRVMADHFSEDTHTFIEYVLHSVCQCEDIEPWERHRMALYAPEDGRPIKRSGHVDARGGEPTYEETLKR